ncbi:MAG: hypothetical protein J6Q89_01230, partial [Clostridia bacterium]|nr:hypothetical protein [Clostridia bacterium]
PFDFVPFPTTAPIYEFDEQLAYDVARNMIAEEFSAILLDNGFVSTDDGFKWHKLKDNMVYYINFAWNKGASISILYNCCTVFDDVKGMHDERAIYALALFDLLKMVGAAIPHEYYPNAFLNGNDVLEWQKNRLSLQLTQIVLPAFNGEIVTDSFDLKKKLPPYLKRICEKTFDKQTTAELTAKYGRIRVTNGVSRQFEDERVLKTNNNDYINLYFSKCKDLNLRYLKDNIFGF